MLIKKAMLVEEIQLDSFYKFYTGLGMQFNIAENK
jgi:hypothetical protein